jgi:hypothetical protein
VSGDFAHTNVMASGMHTLGALVVRLPGKHIFLVSVQLNVANENDELTGRLLLNTDKGLDGLLNSPHTSFSSDNKLIKPAIRALTQVKHFIPDYEHLFREMMVSSPKPSKFHKELLVQCVIRSDPMTVQSCIDELEKTEKGRLLVAKYFSDEEPGSDIRQMALSRRAATRQHPQGDKCACAESYNMKLKRDRVRDSGAVSALAKAESGSWRALHTIHTEWAALDGSAALPSFVVQMEESERRAQGSKEASLVNGPEQIYEVSDNKCDLSNVVDLKVSVPRARTVEPVFVCRGTPCDTLSNTQVVYTLKGHCILRNVFAPHTLNRRLYSKRALYTLKCIAPYTLNRQFILRKEFVVHTLERQIILRKQFVAKNLEVICAAAILRMVRSSHICSFADADCRYTTRS